MSEMKIGSARISSDNPGFFDSSRASWTKRASTATGVYVDHGISGWQARKRGLDNAINAARESDIFCATAMI